MKNKRLFIDIHAIQTLPPSNINRDDTGSPKSAQYGGVRRARVSSQSWKKVIRDYFKENSEASNLGVRTLNIVSYVAEKIQKIDPSIGEDDAMNKAEKAINDSFVRINADKKANALFFFGDRQAEKLAQAAIDGSNKKEIQSILKNNLSIDIALFGRMVAREKKDDPSYLNVEASCQVAHSISTHAVNQEFDYFTAIDELTGQQANAGASHIDTTEFNSSTLYRYANIAIHDLKDQLGDKEATIKTVALFIEAFTKSLPTGKVKSFANQTLPQLVLVSLREDRPVNLVSAYEEPVKSKEGYVEKSIGKLFEEYAKVEKFVDKPIYTAFVSTEQFDQENKEILEKDSLRDLLADIEGKLAENLEDGE
ncbi:type I-E CRISPR-associated protein Cas7/Cse4/CasC [Anaerococcus sp. AGMB09787]|uniref:type I-E CRISPR-associated protein Cas7/Cse4/CasC n=1 Tax=Anaerococcus sp. AGMB09787 TaxID=2922869 RepID=UPI001FAF9D5C|nr:type I-E CRISPR-associated protein Cas7/Cse4/CasC [Anaerococcus sp. AGMB09787]